MSSGFIISMPEPACVPEPGGIGVLLMKSMQKYKDNIAQIDSATGKSQTYGEILSKSITLAQNLQKKGITSEDVVALCTYNTPDSCLPLNACLLLGVPISILDPSFSLSDVKHLLNIVKPRYFFCESESAQVMAKAIEENSLQTEIIDLNNTGMYTPVSSLLISTRLEANFTAAPVTNLHDTAIILFSSGTTGLAKAVCLHHYGLIMQQYNITQRFDVNVCLSLATLYWISAISIYLICYIYGKTRVLYKKFDENTIMSIIQDYKVTVCFMAPVQTYAITKNQLNMKYDTSSLKSIIVGGGVFDEHQYMVLQKYFPNTKIFNSYGMTEAYGLITVFHPEKDERFINNKYGSCGRPIEGISFKIVDVDTNKILGPNMKGEIRLKSQMFSNCYYNNPDANQTAWDEAGYLKTGDVGYYDDDQCFYVIERIKDVLKYRSWHIHPTELESILLTHPDVQEAAVIGVSHEIDGDHPMGFIVLKPGSTVTEQDILNFFNAKVSDRKKLRAGVTFIDGIPRTPTGKLQRRVLRDLIRKILP